MDYYNVFELYKHISLKQMYLKKSYHQSMIDLE